MEIIFDEYDIRKLSPRERLDKIPILRNERHESIRWDSISLDDDKEVIIDETAFKLACEI
jgi:hypothetical protein